ncbi:2-phospho-L-lactate transferase [Paraburkholderia dipogonis]|uniref:2-phospho-L-lactate transferase n=1 Tax=Paraburkholderia dipogonis TaxID=1211383 RepID=A0A4Y8MW05_9BURK|nr:2-phospho-L-lactate transferase [Paraburkholderia dipogonis]TFE41545.1 2-phospho-L-lactate transferase [Paraburkholderia dipogonis]
MCERIPKVVLLAGGVGGARMARGLATVLPAGSLSVIVNVGDDEHFHGLKVCPDLDTVVYTLSGLVQAQRGWGVAGDTTHALDMLRKLKAPDTWMHLGDGDIGLHLFRSECLARGESLTSITNRITSALGTPATIIPASDGDAPTLVDTDQGLMRFQQWFVQERARPAVRAIRYETVGTRVTSSAALALSGADLVVIAPSNPLLSIYPMLALPGFRDALLGSSARCVGVSPLIGGRAVKGPLAEMLTDLKLGTGNRAIATLYRDLLDALVIDKSDDADFPALMDAGLPHIELAATHICDRDKANELARAVLKAGQLNPLGFTEELA